MGLQNRDSDAGDQVSDRLLDEISKILEFQKSGLSDARIDTTRLDGIEQRISHQINQLLDIFVLEQKSISTSLGKIIEGDESAEIPDLPGNRKIITERLSRLHDSLSYLQTDVIRITNGLHAGDVTIQLDSTRYQGGLRDTIDTLNEGLRSIAEPMKIIGSGLHDFAEGVVPDSAPADNYAGEFQRIMKSLNRVVDVSKMRGEDINFLISAAVDGKLDARADPTKYPGYHGRIIEGLNKILDAYISPINVSAEYIDRISKGEVPPRITEMYRGDFNEIKNNLNALIDVVHMRNEDIKMLINSGVDGRLDLRADATKYPGENGRMIEGINKMLDAYLGPLNVSAEYIDRISKGDLPPRITESYRGDFNEIKNNLNNLIDVVNLRNEDIKALIQAAVEGRLDYRADSKKYMGENGRMIDGINQMLDAYIGPINVSAEYIDRISKGDLPPRITDEYHGDFNEIKNNLNTLIDVIHLRNDDISALAAAAVEGKLDFRADTSKYIGYHGKLIDRINNILDSYLGPINVSAEYIDRISKGDLPPRITEDYRGDFNEIKNNLNHLIDVVHMRNRDIQSLIQAATEGKLDFRADAGKYEGSNGKMIDGINKMLDSYIGPINVSAEYIDRISKGDLPPRITDEYRGDFNEIKNNLNALLDVVHMRNTDIQALIQAAIDGKLDVRADPSRYPGENGKMIEGINSMLDAYIGPINVAAEYIDRISKGDLPPVITDQYHGDFNEIKNNLNSCIQTLTHFVRSMDTMYQEQKAGEIDSYLNEDEFLGVYQEMARGVNEDVRLHVNNILKILGIIVSYAQGDFAPVLEKLPGKQIIANQNMDLLRSNLMQLTEDVGFLGNAAREGKLDIRADTRKYQGDFLKIAEGFNMTLDAVINPLNVSAEYIDRISKGDLPPLITDTYYGDFNEIKNNLNALIEVVHMRNADIKLLIQAAIDGKLDVRADSAKYPGENGRMIDGINKMLDAYITPLNLAAEYIDRISKGDLPPVITDEYKGDFNEIKNNLNQCINAIHLLIDDANRLSVASVQGDLNVRADASRHQGDFAKVVTGINDTLDAVIGPLREAMRISDNFAKCNFAEKFNQSILVQGDFLRFRDSLNLIGDAISTTIGSLISEINSLSHHAATAQFGVEDVSRGAREISLNAEETSANAAKSEDGIDQVLRAMSDLTVMVSEISGNADMVARLSEDANNLAQKGTEYAENADKGMVSITRSSSEVENIITEIRSEMNQIRKIVNIITDLANQTNLLALNAAIEAARAGDAGRGFAVVASEVKSLAQESRSSAESIADMIQGLERKSDNAAVAIEAAGKAVNEGNAALTDTLHVFNELTTAVDTINQKMLTIARATEQQAASFEEITASANEMSVLVKKTADDATHSSATSEEALAVVSQITDIIELINQAVANMHQEMEIFTLRKA